MSIERRRDFPQATPPTNYFKDIRFLPEVPPIEVDLKLFEDPQFQKKMTFLEMIFDYERIAGKKEKKKTLDKIACQLVIDPDDCLFFYQTLREYEEANKDRFFNLFEDIRNKLPEALRGAAKSEIIQGKTEHELENYFKSLIKYLPDLEDPIIREEKSADIDFAKASKSILKGFIKSCEDQKRITDVLYGINLGAFTLGGEKYEKWLFNMITGLTDLFNPKDEQLVISSAAIYSNSNETVRQFFIVDRISMILQQKYYPNEGLIYKLGQEARNNFPGLYESYEQAAIKRDKIRFNKIREFQKNYMYAENDISVIEWDEYTSLDFPLSILHRPSKLWYEYVKLLQEVNKTRLQTITIPHDQTVRTIVEKDSLDFEHILRRQYLIGNGNTLDNPYFLRDVLFYLKPEYQDNESELYQKTAMSFDENLVNIANGLITVNLKIGKYQLPLTFDVFNHRLVFANDSPLTEIPGEKLILWQDYISELTMHFINEKKKKILTENRLIKDKDQVEQLLGLFYPFALDNEEKVAVSQKAKEAQENLKIGEESRVIHPFGTLIKIKKNKYTTVSSLLFSYGDHSRINVSINIGRSKINLALDKDFNLVHLNGNIINLPPNILDWWRSIIFSHLSEYLFKEGTYNIAQEYLNNYTPEHRETIRKFLPLCTPYRRHLPYGFKLNPEHSLALENYRLMEGVLRKTPQLPGENFLQAYNRLNPSSDERLRNWVLPPSDEKIEELIKQGRLVRKPVIINTPNALNFIKK